MFSCIRYSYILYIHSLDQINDSHPPPSVVATSLPVLGDSVTALQESKPCGNKDRSVFFENMKEDYDNKLRPVLCISLMMTTK